MFDFQTPPTHICHLGLWPCSGKSRLLSLMTILAKSVRSTKSEVMMLTPSTPGRWASTQDMMVGRFLEPQVKKKLWSKANKTSCPMKFCLTWKKSQWCLCFCLSVRDFPATTVLKLLILVLCIGTHMQTRWLRSCITSNTVKFPTTFGPPAEQNQEVRMFIQRW